MNERGQNSTEGALEARARRAAKRAGLIATKSLWRRNSVDNHGGFQILDPSCNTVVEGVRYELTAADVIEFCAERRTA